MMDSIQNQSDKQVINYNLDISISPDKDISLKDTGNIPSKLSPIEKAMIEKGVIPSKILEK
jgi:hypothetical protein